MSRPIADLDGAAFAAAVRRVAAQASQSNADGPLHNAIHLSAVPGGLQLVAANRYGCAVETVPATVHDATWGEVVGAAELVATTRHLADPRTLSEDSGYLQLTQWCRPGDAIRVDVRYPLAGVLMNLPTEPCVLLQWLEVGLLREALAQVIRAVGRTAPAYVDLAPASDLPGAMLRLIEINGSSRPALPAMVLYPDRLPRVDVRLLRRMADSLPIRATLALAQQGPSTALLWTCDAAPAYRCLIMPVTTYEVAARAGRLGKAVGS